MDFFIKKLNYDNVHCLFQLWDIISQERFRYILENFVMGAKGALLLFNLTRMPKIEDLLEWVNIVRLHNLMLPILLIGTKFENTR